MPVDNGVGYGAYTPQKIDCLRSTMRMHIKLTQAVMAKYSYYNQVYHYIDATAGPGKCPNLGVDGSPLVFLNVARELNLDYRADFVEMCADILDQLRSSVNENGYGNVNYHQDDYANALPGIAPFDKNRLGLIFVDPTGEIPDFDPLIPFVKKRPRMEILLYVAATTIKRRNALLKSQGDESGKLLEDYMRSLGKKHWLVREPMGSHHFTFVLGSNFDLPDYKKEGYYRIDSEQGHDILAVLNLPKPKENKRRQMMQNKEKFKVSTGEAPPDKHKFSNGATRWGPFKTELLQAEVNTWYKFEFESSDVTTQAGQAARRIFNKRFEGDDSVLYDAVRFPRDSDPESKPGFLWIRFVTNGVSENTPDNES